jgi:hypothetical protein
MRRTIFASLSLFLAVAVLGCSGDSKKEKDSKAGKESSPESKGGKHEAVIKGMTEQMSAFADALESVKDKESAKAAAAKIDKVCDRMKELGKEAKDLPKLPKDEDEKLKAKYEPEMKKVQERIKKATPTAAVKSMGEADFVKALQRFSETAALPPPGEK